jgi:hypothetical protein
MFTKGANPHLFYVTFASQRDVYRCVFGTIKPSKAGAISEYICDIW